MQLIIRSGTILGKKKGKWLKVLRVEPEQTAKGGNDLDILEEFADILPESDCSRITN